MANHLDIFAGIEAGAHGGAFGHNPLPTPTHAQCEAGNYKVGRISLYGIPIAIEQPRNSFRSGIDQSGNEWRCRLGAHYGYLSGTKGADGDAVDCFIGPWPQAETVYVINQNVGGQFDEHKVMLAFADEAMARRAYLDSYDRGWNGLKSLVSMSVPQFKWWLKHGNKSRPAVKDYLPFEGHEAMKTTKKVYWDGDASPIGMTLDQVLYEIRRDDAEDGLVFDSLSADDFHEIADEVMALDALVTPYAAIQRTMNVLNIVMSRASGAVSPLSFQITDPYKFRGVVNVAVIWELSDGQTVSILLHNPDSTPSKLAPTDELVSWKWLLNKKDITIIVAPEKGVDLNIREVARRIMRLAEKNSAAFQRANTRRAERMQNIQALKDEIAGMENTLAGLLHQIEVAEVAAEPSVVSASPSAFADEIDIDRAATEGYESGKVGKTLPPDWVAGTDILLSSWKIGNRRGIAEYKAQIIDPTTPEGYAKAQADEALLSAHAGQLDSLFIGRIEAVRQALRDLGWFHPDGTDGNQILGYLAKGNEPDGYQGLLAFSTSQIGAGNNIVGVRYHLTNVGPVPFELADDLTKTTGELAAMIDSQWVSASNARAEASLAEEEVSTAAAEEALKAADASFVNPVVVSLTGNELGEFPDTEEGKKELRQAARKFLNGLRGKMVPCPAIGKDVEIRKRGIKETMAFSADPRKLKLVSAIEQLISTGVGGEKEPNYKPEASAKQEVIAYYRLHNTAQLDGAVLAIEVIIEEDSNGHLYYDFLVERGVEKGTAALDSSGAADVLRVPPDHDSGTGSKESIDPAAVEVNPVLDSVGGEQVFNLFIEGEAPEVIEEENDETQAPLSIVDVAGELTKLGWGTSLDENSLLATIYTKGGAVDVSIGQRYNEPGVFDIDGERLDPVEYPTAQAIARHIDAEYRYDDDTVADAIRSEDIIGEFAGKTFEFAKSALIVSDTARRMGGDIHFGDYNYSMSEGLFDGAEEGEGAAQTIPELPYGICAQIIKDGKGIGRARIDEDGLTVIYAGLSGAVAVDIGGAPAAPSSSYGGIVDMVEILFATASQPAVEAPAVVEPPPAEDPQKAEDIALFQSVIDGTVPNIDDPALADLLELAFLRHHADTDMASLFEKAVDAYQAAMMAATANLA